MVLNQEYLEEKEREAHAYYHDINLQRDELSMNLGGGIPKKSLMLAVGEDGAGKSILAQRLLYSFVRNKATVSYISSELNTISFVEQMESMDYDIKYDLLNGRVLFIPMFPVMGSTTPSNDFMTRLLKTKEIFEKDIIIFDTLSFLMIRNNITQDECYNLINMLKRMTSLGKTILFMVDPNHLNDTMLSLLKSVSDIFVNLAIRSFAGNVVRVINIVRFKRPQGEFQANIPFRVEPGKGLAIEIASLD
ncbi:MAG: ATPase domain-containing protein [Candidatus Woesearchaeota archaeon]